MMSDRWSKFLMKHCENVDNELCGRCLNWNGNAPVNRLPHSGCSHANLKWSEKRELPIRYEHRYSKEKPSGIADEQVNSYQKIMRSWVEQNVFEISGPSLAYGRSPVCVRTWFVRSVDRAKRATQFGRSHANLRKGSAKNNTTKIRRCRCDKWTSGRVDKKSLWGIDWGQYSQERNCPSTNKNMWDWYLSIVFLQCKRTVSRPCECACVWWDRSTRQNERCTAGARTRIWWKFSNNKGAHFM